MARTPRKRYLRHGRYERQRRSRHLLAFLNEKADALEYAGVTEIEFTAVDSEAASGVLSVTESENFAEGETVTIGEIVYTFVDYELAYGGEPYEVLVGSDAEESLENLAAAITAGEGEGVVYGEGTVAHPLVTADVQEGALFVQALEVGDAGNSIATETDAQEADFDYATLLGGVDASNVLSATAHGLSVGDGPFQLQSSDELPPGLEEGRNYWVKAVPTENTFTLTSVRGGPETSVFDVGSGTQEIAAGVTPDAVYEYLRQSPPEVVRDADDADDLAS